MNAVERFFRHYVLSTIGILVLFLCVNLALLAGIFVFLSVNGATEGTFPTGEFSNHIAENGDGPEADPEAMDILRDTGAWAMILNDEGTVIWEENLPDDLPRQYTVTDVALFSRWYLEDYPIRIWKRAEGLLVVGFPPGSILQLYMSFKLRYFWLLLAGTVGIILANILLMIFLFLRNAHRLEKAIGPILNGIRSLSSGKSFHLEEKGGLAEINASLNRAGDYLIKKDNTRAEWIRGVSHDMRTPLSMILGNASEMEDTDTLPIATREQAGIICRQSKKMSELIDSLNLTTRLEYAMYPIHLQTINPVELARQVVIGFLNDGLPEHYELVFSNSESQKPVLIKGDPALLHRMLCNLIRNSIVHNPQGCKIMVFVEHDSDTCIFSVLDNGRGIGEPKLHALNNHEAIRSTQGEQNIGYEHGLGLKIVCQIVRANGGEIRFSHMVPHGLGVKISFPLCAEKNGTAEAIPFSENSCI